MARRLGRAAAGVFLLLLSCAGPAARENILLPALVLSWPGVAEDIEAGITADLAAGKIVPTAADTLRGGAKALGAALALGDHASLASLPLKNLQQEALNGIDAKVASGKAGPNGAGILKERVANFNAALTQYLK